MTPVIASERYEVGTLVHIESESIDGTIVRVEYGRYFVKKENGKTWIYPASDLTAL